MVSEEAQGNYPYCFGCGEQNPIGLGLKYRLEGEFLVTEFVPEEVHQGWPDILHGGIIGSLLYEVMENFPYQRGIVAMMRGMETRFRRPGRTNKRIIARSWLVEQSGRELSVASTLTGEEDELIAEGTASLVILSEQQKKRLGISQEVPRQS